MKNIRPEERKIADVLMRDCKFALFMSITRLTTAVSLFQKLWIHIVLEMTEARRTVESRSRRRDTTAHRCTAARIV